MTTSRTHMSKSGHDITKLDPEAVQALTAKLTPEQYEVTQRAGTEPAFCGTLVDNHKDGFYSCVVCDLPLFSSEHKYESGSGWPSFTRPFDREHVAERRDTTLGMERTEIACARCGAHLGHVFTDGPGPRGLRYCLNSAALTFNERQPTRSTKSRRAKSTETAFFAGGCFWGVEYAFQRLPGVIDAESGYQNGSTSKPTYESVSSDTTGHAETVKVVFDPAKKSYEQLVRYFFSIHDPTTLNQQGVDVGSQYRSAIFYADEGQKAVAERIVGELTAQGTYGGRPIVTALEPAGRFWPAERYHQNFVERTGMMCHIDVAAAPHETGID